MKRNFKAMLSLVMLAALSGCELGTTTSSSTSSVANDSSSVSVSTSATSSESSSSSDSSSSEVSSSSSSSSSAVDSSSSSSSVADSSSSSSSSSSASSSSDNSSSSSSDNSSNDSSDPVPVVDVKDVIQKGIDNQSKVKKGTLVNNPYGFGEDSYTYEFGKDSYGDFAIIEEPFGTKYYGYNASKEFYGLNKSKWGAGNLTSVMSPKEDSLKGPSINPVSSYMYGVDGLMSYVLGLVKKDANKDFTMLGNYDGSNFDAYEFSVGEVVPMGDTNYLWVYTISFIMESDAFSKVYAYFDKYDESSITADFENVGVYTLNEDATPMASRYAIYNQVIGERDASNPHDIESYYFDSFDLKDSDGNDVGDSITLKDGVQASFSVVNSAPSTVLWAIDKPQLRVVEGDAVFSINSNSENTVSLTANATGTYTIEIYTHAYTKRLTVTVVQPEPETMGNIYYYKNTANGMAMDFYSGTAVEVYKGSNVYFKSSVNPTKAEQGYSIKAVGDNADDASFEKTTITVGIRDHEVYKASFANAGIYTLRAYSTTNENVYKDFNVQVNEPPAIETLVANRYYTRSETGGLGVDINFTPNADDASKGTVSVVDTYSEESNATYNYEYDATTREFALTKADDSSTPSDKLFFSENYELVYFRSSQSVNVALKVFNLTDFVRGEWWTGWFDIDTENETRGYIMFNFSTDGSGSFSYMNGGNSEANISCSFKYTITENNDGTYSINFDDAALETICTGSDFSEIKSITLSSNFSKIEFVTVYNGVETTFSFTTM